jgi:hypothetical protein
MEATREIYWNVGHGVILPMYFFAFIAIAVLLYGFYRRFATYKLGKSLNRLDRLPERISLFLKNTFAQTQVLRAFSMPYFSGASASSSSAPCSSWPR